MKRKAFTLIELLVVIAIIAILAAILFPVFAQAKVAAKGAAAISDVKQQSLGMIMYSGDYDDNWVVAAAWNTGSDPVCYGANTCLSTWTWLINPYEKKPRHRHRSARPCGFWFPVAGRSWLGGIVFWPTFGYNYNALAPYEPPPGPNGGDGHTAPLTNTAVEFPANTVMLDAKYATSEWEYPIGDGLGFSFTANTDNGPALQTTMDPPDCSSINSYCIGNWGYDGGGQWSGLLAPGGTVAGEFTGGNSQRGVGASEAAFCDGHAKKMSGSALAAGTNWVTGTGFTSTTLVVNNVSRYLWWAIPETGN